MSTQNPSPEQQWERWYAEWKEAAWHFTYMDEEEKDRPVLQGGFVAIFYFVDAAQTEKRAALVQVLREFSERYGEQLRWGAWGSRYKLNDYSKQALNESVAVAKTTIEDNAVQFIWSSATTQQFSGNYQIDAYSIARWSERVHLGVSHLRFHFPVELLHRGQANQLLPDLLRVANLMGPLSGYGGLGFQQSYDFINYEHLECEQALEFNGLDVGNPVGKRSLRHGIKSINWLTFVNDSLLALAPLGGRRGLKEQAERINRHLRVLAVKKGEPPQQLSLHFYDSGVMVQAGDWPQLGWVERDPWPIAYVAANLLLRPVRVDEIGSLHTGSIVGEVRFDKASSNRWLRRFDAASDAMQRDIEAAAAR